jgi:hypothetical protein
LQRFEPAQAGFVCVAAISIALCVYFEKPSIDNKRSQFCNRCRSPFPKKSLPESVRLLPNAQHYTVGRFYSRTEAENHKRFLGKWMPAAEFEVVFDSDAVT